MRRESAAEIEAIAAQRLERLRAVGSSESSGSSEAVVGPVLEPLLEQVPSRVPRPGRHARDRAPSPGERAGAWAGDRLPGLAGTIRLRAGHLTGLLLVAVLVLGATAWWAVHRTTPTVPVSAPIARTSASVAPAAFGSRGSPGGPSSSDSPASSGMPAASAPAGVVVVDVAGKVRRPGIVTLPAGSRVVDALRRAGGARAGVDLTALNLARVLVDGEQLLVGQGAGSGAAGLPGSSVATGAAGAAASAGGPGGAGGAATDGATVNLNTATAEALEALPGVGPVTAQKIVAWRTEHGAFRSVDDLLEVSGIGPKTLAELAPRATL